MKGRIYFLFSIISILWVGPGMAQNWTITDPTLIGSQGKKDIVPQKFVVYNTDYASVKEILWTSPKEESQPISSSSALITVGLADGTMDVFRMVQYDMMEPELSMSYPEIRTFIGQSVSNPLRTIRADWTVNGFRAVIRDERGMMYIDPFQRNDLSNRIAYFRKDFIKSDPWVCDFTEKENVVHEHQGQRAFGDCMLRSYRLALAADGEYSNYFGAFSSSQSGLVMSEVVTAINRVNEVYEADVTARLILVGNDDLLFYYNPSTDPYTNDNGSTMLGQNQTTCDNVIGNANYDIGHVFSTGGGGVAYLNALCTNNIKAGGVTGLTNPDGDAFYIDYVAHEMGHQFGGNHTFNGTAGSCGGGNRSPNSAYEPGSGSTIMAYAGICGAQDIQPHSDAYFHARSLLEMSNHMTGTGCAAFITLNNTAPVATAVADHTIPISTPFVLTAVATDANNDPLTYCWEEYDLEGTSSEPPTSNDIDGPMFRSLEPTSSPDRYLPRLSDLTTNTNYTWEVLPSVTRTMTFRMTVRDYHNIAGCTDEDDVVISTTSTSGPFTVTSQNLGATWLEGSVQTITWNVANTTASPVSCANVDIKLSYDGGFTYPGTLALNEPNDGSATVTIPVGTSTDGRVMVKASNNIFFDINNADITIDVGPPNFTISLNPTQVTECNDGSVQTTVSIGSYLGFSNPVTLSLLNPPPGAAVSFVPTVVVPGNTSTLTISNLTGLSGNFTPIVRGSSTTGNQDVTFIINLTTPASAPTLNTPTNHQINIDLRAKLTWAAVSNATSYDYEVSTNNSFNPILFSGNLVTNQVLLSTLLQNETIYYWRVRSNNLCGQSAWSSVFDFKTMICQTYSSTDVPQTISSHGSPTITSTLNIPISVNLLDINVTDLGGTHTYVNDLKFTLLSPGSSTQVLFWDQPCGDDDNFNINFDDEAANSDWPCPPTNGLTYKPSNPMTPFDGLNSSGIWTLEVEDVHNFDGGSLNSWGLKVCNAPVCTLLVTQIIGSGPGSLPAALSCAMNGDSIKLSSSLTGQTINIGSSPLQIDKNVVIIALGSNTTITTSGTRVFDVTNLTTTQLNGMIVRAGTSLTGGAISNAGNLTLKNVTVQKNTGVTGATLLQNITGGQLFMVGNCFINQ